MTAQRIIVLGAGVVGTTTAYKLAMDGHDVTVIDAEDGVAMMTSYANAGLVAPGHAFAWASPAAPGMMLRSQWRGDQAIRLKLRPSWLQWKWMARFLRECTAERARSNTATKADLCRFSQLHLHGIVAESGISYDGDLFLPQCGRLQSRLKKSRPAAHQRHQGRGIVTAGDGRARPWPCQG